jgi:hypothetical protein
LKRGLVAYRDQGDSYVTQVLPVTRDLDNVYNALMAYKAEGGGDSPEDVRQALANGVHKVGWSPRSPNIAQILFLVGDAPPHDDYGDEPDTVKLDALKTDDLPDELQKLSAEERKKVVTHQIEEREKIRLQILELSKKRDAFLREERKKQSAKNPTGFDEAVSTALKAQIARKGLKP